MTLTPAYGRDYKSKGDVVAAWNLGADFTVADMFSGGAYANRADVERAGNVCVTIRYSQLRKVCVLYRKGDAWK